MVDPEVYRKKREGKVLVERNDGFYDYRNESNVSGDYRYERVEITEWAKDEDGIARKCGTGVYRYEKRKDY